MTDLVLSSEQIQAYRRNGFLVLGTLIPPDEIAILRDAYDRIFRERAGRDAGEQFDLAGTDDDDAEAKLPQILNPSKFLPELQQISLQAAAMAVARQILGDEVQLLGEHAILKPPRDGAETPWHQDEAYWDASLEYDALSIWVPLQDATLENGCMQFIPGSYTSGVVPHRPIGNDPRVHGLEVVEPVDISKAVACPIPAGAATVHGNATLHYTSPNRSDGPRRAYILSYMTPPVKRDVPRDFHWIRSRQTARDERAKAALGESSSSNEQ